MRHYLIVDDNAALAENAAEIVREAGDAADVALSGADALERIRSRRYDALVSDLRMPGMDGRELLTRARAFDPGLPVLIISAFASPEVTDEVRSLGVYALLPKPVPLRELLAMLARARRDGLVALVEDDAALRENLAEGLHEQGFSVVSAGTVEEAAALCGSRPSCAVIDLRVPGGPDGAAVERVLACRPDVPVVAMTGFAAEACPEGVQHLLRKPFATGELLRLVSSLCPAPEAA